MIASSALKTYFSGLQARLVAAAEALEGEHGARGERFRADPWQKEPGQTLTGSGLTCIIEGGRVFERGGDSGNLEGGLQNLFGHARAGHNRDCSIGGSHQARSGVDERLGRSGFDLLWRLSWNLKS